jgi:hypothetical protein
VPAPHEDPTYNEYSPGYAVDPVIEAFISAIQTIGRLLGLPAVAYKSNPEVWGEDTCTTLVSNGRGANIIIRQLL